MRLNLKATGSVVLTPELQEFVETKIKKLEKLIDPADTTAMADVELCTTVGGQRSGDVYKAEINIQYVGGFTRAEATDYTMHRAIDTAVDEGRRELRKTFGKRRELMRRGAMKVKDFFRRFTGS